MKRKELHERMAEDAEFAFDLVGQIARDPKQTAKVRLHAAELLMNRTWGKPRQGIDLTHTEAPPAVDIEAQRRLLDDPSACELAADLDARLALPPS